MDRTNGENPEGIGSVKAAISLYGQKIHGKNQKHSPSKSGELHLAQLDIGRLNETNKSAEIEKARAESELNKAKGAARELALEIEQSNAKAKAQKLEHQSLRKLNMNDRRYSELMQELSDLKQELSRMKLDVASTLEAKAKAEKEIEDSNSRVKSYMSSVEELSKEIEAVNEEHVLVELARIEAEREIREIEDQRKADATRFSKSIETAKEKIGDLQKEVAQAKELERKLAVTNSDLSVLQSEMEFVRAMERNFQKNRREEDPEAQLKSAKKELASIKEEGFQFMASMDVVRKELMLIANEIERLKKQEKKTDSAVQHLNSKLLKVKSKLESTSAAEKRAKAIVSNLLAALQQLRMESETVKKEKEMIAEETKSIKLKIELTEPNICSAEERLQAAVLELEAVKASEANALNNLRDVTERTMKNRAFTSLHSSTITISKCEYEYLSKCAKSAQVVADKKVAAAEAWIEALKAEEKEMLMKSEMVEKEIKELRIAEETELCKIEETLAAQKTVENEMTKEEEEEFSNLQLVEATPRKSIRENGMTGAATRKAKMRRSSASPGIRHNARSPSFTIRKKKKVMPSLVKFLRSRSSGKQK